MNNGRYIQRAESVLAEAKRQDREGVGQCRDCRFYSLVGEFFLGASCRNPIVKLASENTHDASSRRRIQEHDYQRGDKDYFGPVLCGPDGFLWEGR